MAESGFGGVLSRFPGNLNATARQQAVFDDLVNRTSCAPTVGTAAAIDCLREAAFEEINDILTADAATNAFVWSPVIDGDFIADYPYNQLRDGRFVQVPVLIGCNSDEGTSKGSTIGANGTGGVSTDDEFRASIIEQFGLDGVLAATTFPGSAASTPDKAAQLVDELMVLYPNIQAIGLPDLDKLPVIVAGDAVANASGLQFRRASSIYGDKYVIAHTLFVDLADVLTFAAAGCTTTGDGLVLRGRPMACRRGATALTSCPTELPVCFGRGCFVLKKCLY